MINQLITKTLRNAKSLPLDKGSKYILFSDLHKGNNSYADDFAQNMRIYKNALHHYYINNYSYIELGDGLELWENNKAQPIIKAHRIIFDLLAKFHKKKRLHLIYGNHDMIFRFPFIVKKVFQNIFTEIDYHESIILQSESNNKSLFLMHGHQADFFSYYFWWLGRFLVRYIWNPLQFIGVNDPTSPAKNYKELIKVERRIKDWIVSHKNQPVIFGHTHRPRFPQPIDIPMFNTGSCVHPDSITGIEIENMTIAMVKWHYNNKGNEVIKEYMEEPLDLDLYW